MFGVPQILSQKFVHVKRPVLRPNGTPSGEIELLEEVPNPLKTLLYYALSCCFIPLSCFTIYAISILFAGFAVVPSRLMNNTLTEFAGGAGETGSSDE